MIAEDLNDELQFIYTTFYEWYVDKKFDKANRFLETWQLETASITSLLGILSITAGQKHRLPYRQTFYSRVEERITKEEGHAKAKELLRNLE